MRYLVLLTAAFFCATLGFSPATEEGTGAARESGKSAAPRQSKARWSGVVLRVEFVFPERRAMSLGTGFVVRDRAKNLYLVTCSHLLRDRDWDNRYSVHMQTMDGQRRIESLGSNLLAGAAVDLKRPMSNGWPDMTHDLVVRPIAGSWAHPLRLAKSDPGVGDWVWAVGCEAREPPGDERLFRGRVSQVANGGFVFEKIDPFDPRGFSGGPVVNSSGEVVGNILAGSGNLVSGATVNALRGRLHEAGIQID
jgi:S1-C subfamily serine protease